jgi:hypothetical protein
MAKVFAAASLSVLLLAACRSAAISPLGNPSELPTQSSAPTAKDSNPGESANPGVPDLVFSITPWIDVVSPFTMSLQADGRLITTPLVGSTEQERALVQRRLTASGVDLVRHEIMATGLFNSDGDYGPIPLPGHELPGRGTTGYRVMVGTDTGIVRVAWTSVTSDEAEWAYPSDERTRLDALGKRLTALEWLPLDLWADHLPSPYVPERYHLVTISQPWGGAISDLPLDVTAVSWPLDASLLTFGTQQTQSSESYLVRCAVVDVSTAEQVIDALSQAGAPFSAPLGEGYATAASLGDRSTIRVIDVVLVALHPHQTDCLDARWSAF